MAVVGSAEVIVRAITTNVNEDIKKGFRNVDSIGGDAGDRVGRSFARGLNRSAGNALADIFDADNFVRASEAARQQFASLQRASFAIVPAITALGGAIGALIGGIGVLGITVAAATPVLIGFGNGFAALAVSAGILRAVFGDVTKAIEAQNAVTGAAVENQKRIDAATRRVADANYDLNDLIKQQAQDLADLEEQRARQADAVTDANIAVERSERSYQRALKDVEEAIQDVNDAREEAKEKIQQLRFELEGGVISEKKARLEFEKARDSLQRVQDLPPNSRARREAEIAFAEADLNLRRAIDKNNDLRKATDKANREGVDGNKDVLKAEERLIRSREAAGDAEIAAAQAVRSLTLAKQELKKIDDSLLAGSEREIDAARALELAKRAVADAEKELQEAEKGGTAGAALQEAMDKLSPSAKEFVKLVGDLKERFDELKLVLQEEFFSKFNKAVKDLSEIYLPILEEALPKIAAALGTVAQIFATVFGDPQVVAAVAKIFEEMEPTIINIGTAAANLAAAFTILLGAFSPFFTKFTEYVAKLTEGWLETIKLKEKTGELEEAFKTASEIMYSLFRSIGNVLGTIGNLIKATFSEGGGGWYFLTWLEKVTEKWEQFTKRGAEDGSLDKYILGLSVSFTKLLEIIGLIVKGFLDIAATQGFADFLDSIKNAVETFNEVGLDIAENALPAVGRFIEKIAELIALFTDAASIRIFFETLTVAIEAIVTLLDNEVGRAFVGGIGAIVAFGLALGTLSKTAGFFGKVFVGSITQIDKVLLAKLPQGSKLVYNLRFAVLALQNGMIALAAPILIAVGVIAAIIAVIKLAWDNSEKFREAVAKLTESVKTAVRDGLEKIKAAFDKLEGPMMTIQGLFEKIGDFLAITIVPLFEFILVGAINILVGVIVGLIEKVASFFEKIENGKKKVEDFFSKVKEVFDKIDKLSIGDIFAGIKESFKAAINFVIRKWNELEFDIRMPDKFLGIPLPGFIAGQGITIKTPNIPLLAQGGIVYPQPGGTLARIAEAGRPERVEPLDPDGLSQRDRAMIQLLAGESRGIQITVNPSPGMDERELAALVSRQLAFQLRKGAA